jgi:hypothetical protein
MIKKLNKFTVFPSGLHYFYIYFNFIALKVFVTIGEYDGPSTTLGSNFMFKIPRIYCEVILINYTSFDRVTNCSNGNYNI